MLLSTPNWVGTTIGTMTAAENTIAKDTFFQQQMQSSIKSWLYSLAKSNTSNGLSATTKIQKVYPWWHMALFVADGVFGVLTILFVILGLFGKKKKTENVA